MTATQALETLDQLLRQLGSLQARLASECEEISAWWSRLGRVGGQRDDRGAELLKRLRPHLGALGDFARRSAERLEQTIADPFGDR